MEKFSELISIRRSMRKFTEEELNQDEVVALLRAALISPSSKGVRPWEFVVVDNKELLQQLAHCKEHGDLGLGACWVQIRNRTMADGKPAEEMVRAILHIPAHLRVLSIVAVGHKGMERKPFNEDRLQWEKVHINTFDAPEE